MTHQTAFYAIAVGWLCAMIWPFWQAISFGIAIILFASIVGSWMDERSKQYE